MGNGFLGFEETTVVGMRAQNSIIDQSQTGGTVTRNSFDPEAVVDAMLPLLGLSVTHESRAQTIVHLRIAAELAQQFLSPSFNDQEEPAPVFRP
jgi:hypothetical protein